MNSLIWYALAAAVLGYAIGPECYSEPATLACLAARP